MMFICTLFRVLTLIAGPTTVLALKNLEITVPKAVISGHPVTMTCTYDLEGAPLYSIRWYRAETEFYRYVPKEIPPTRVFPLPSAEVDLELSNQHDVRLIGLHRQLTGEYQCEVSADAPLFHTDIKSAFMFVADVPESDPILSVDRLSYSVGETIRANCSSPSSYPATNITWYINDQKVSDTITSTLPLDPDIWEAESSSSYIEISTEHAEEMRQYQVGGSFSQTSSAQLKPLYTKNSIQLMPGSEYDYSNFNQQHRLDNMQRKPYDADYRSQYLSEDSLKDYISRSIGTKANVRKVYMKPGLGGIFTLRCEANIFDVYTGKSLVYKIKEDTPQIASVMGQESSGAEMTIYSATLGHTLVKISISMFFTNYYVIFFR